MVLSSSEKMISVRRRITSLMVPNGAVIIAQPSTRLYTVTKQLSPVGTGQARTSYRGN